MNKYIKTFETDAEYQTFISGDIDRPNLTYVKETDEVYYNKKENDYLTQYLTFEALEDGTFSLTLPSYIDAQNMSTVSYSIDGGQNWTTTTIDDTNQTITTPTIAAGNKVLWKGDGNAISDSNTSGKYSYFSSTGNFNVSGNVMSLLYDDDFQNQTEFVNSTRNHLSHLFYGCSTIISAENMILPATTLGKYCYTRMFQNCTSLTSVPVLPAPTLAQGCYSNIFSGCSNVNNITMLATDISASGSLNNWVSNVAATGTLTKAASVTTLPEGGNGIPSGWTVVDV